jgi:endonuclease/exonuclease/phosphatase family metal-dependent hydrolase
VLFTRHGLVSVRRHALPWPADPGKETMARVAIEATLQAPMGALRVTTTHLEYYSDIQRRAQAQRLRHLHDEACQRAAQPGAATAERGPFDAIPHTTRAILCGDFNFPPENAAYGDIQHSLAAGVPAYRDAWPIVHGHRPHEATFCVHSKGYSKTPYCCDFVFVSADVAQRVRNVTVNAQTQASDHQPVLLEFDDL